MNGKFEVGFEHVKRSVIGKDNSIMEVVTALGQGAAIIVQVAATVAFVMALWPIFFYSWSDGNMLVAMGITFVFAFLMIASITGWFGWLILRRTMTQRRESNGQFGGKLRPVFVDVDGKKEMYYEVKGVKIPAEDIENLIESK